MLAIFINYLLLHAYRVNSNISLAVEKLRAFASPCGLAKEVLCIFNYFANLFIYFKNLLIKGTVFSYNVMSIDYMSAYYLS